MILLGLEKEKNYDYICKVVRSWKTKTLLSRNNRVDVRNNRIDVE